MEFEARSRRAPSVDTARNESREQGGDVRGGRIIGKNRVPGTVIRCRKNPVLTGRRGTGNHRQRPTGHAAIAARGCSGSSIGAIDSHKRKPSTRRVRRTGCRLASGLRSSGNAGAGLCRRRQDAADQHRARGQPCHATRQCGARRKAGGCAAHRLHLGDGRGQARESGHRETRPSRHRGDHRSIGAGVDLPARQPVFRSDRNGGHTACAVEWQSARQRA